MPDNYLIMKKVLFVLMVLAMASCDPTGVNTDIIEVTEAEPIGTLVVDFQITHQWIPTDRIIRSDLHIALNAYDLYRGKYIQSANVTSSQQKYFFFLPPGDYWLVAGIACLCEGDSCSGGGFPGNKWGQKFMSNKFNIKEDETTDVTIRFLQ